MCEAMVPMSVLPVAILLHSLSTVWACKLGVVELLTFLAVPVIVGFLTTLKTRLVSFTKPVVSKVLLEAFLVVVVLAGTPAALHELFSHLGFLGTLYELLF